MTSSGATWPAEQACFIFLLPHPWLVFAQSDKTSNVKAHCQSNTRVPAAFSFVCLSTWNAETLVQCLRNTRDRGCPQPPLSRLTPLTTLLPCAKLVAIASSLTFFLNLFFFCFLDARAGMLFFLSLCQYLELYRRAVALHRWRD